MEINYTCQAHKNTIEHVWISRQYFFITYVWAEWIPCSNNGAGNMGLFIIQLRHKERQSKVGNLWIQIFVKKNIGCFDVPVYNWGLHFFMKVGKSSSDIYYDSQTFDQSNSSLFSLRQSKQTTKMWSFESSTH